MTKPILHFSHANGFPGSCYQQLFNYLADDFTVGYLDAIAHDPVYPVSDNWPLLVDELIATLRARYQEPVIGVGHSLGGVLTFLAAAREPQLFRGIVLLDAPVLTPWRSFLLKLSKRFGGIEYLVPQARNKTRRNYWETLAEARNHFQGKGIFAAFDQSCLEDYLQHALIKEQHGYILKFKPHIEYLIYHTLPHTMPATPTLQVPAGLLYGKESQVVPLSVRRYMHKRYNFKNAVVPGSHLFPLEHPQMTALAVKEMLNYITPSSVIAGIVR